MALSRSSPPTAVLMLPALDRLPFPPLLPLLPLLLTPSTLRSFSPTVSSSPAVFTFLLPLLVASPLFLSFALHFCLQLSLFFPSSVLLPVRALYIFPWTPGMRHTEHSVRANSAETERRREASRGVASATEKSCKLSLPKGITAVGLSAR